MVDKLPKPESKNEPNEPSQLSNVGSSLDLLREGRTLSTKQSNDSANSYLAPLDIVMAAPTKSGVPVGTTDGARNSEANSNAYAVSDKSPVAVEPKVDTSVNPFFDHAIDCSPRRAAYGAIPPAAADKAPGTPEKIPSVSELDVPDRPAITSPLNFAASTESLPSSEIAEATYSIFNRIDENNNGFLSKEELANAVEDSSYKGQESQVISGLYSNVEMLSNLSDDELFGETSGITRRDMAKFDSLEADLQSERSSLNDGSRWEAYRFSSFDTSKNHFLSREEIDTGLARQNLDPVDQQTLTYLKNNFDKVGSAHDDKEWFWQTKEITRADIGVQNENLYTNGNEAKTVNAMMGMIDRTAQMQSPEISRSLYSDKDNPELSVTPTAIRRFRTDDSYFLASVVALAKSDPESIVQMIGTNPDGTYTVTFPGDKSHPVTVEAPTDSELGMFNGGSPAGTWGAVLEKSYGKYLKTYEGRSGATDFEGVSHGGGPIDALQTLTGRDDFNVESVSSFSKARLTAMLINNFKDGNGKPIVATTDKLFSGPLTEFGYPRLDYAITGFAPNLAGECMVAIQDPWLGRYSNTNTLEISIDAFQKNFEHLIYENKL